MRKDSSSAFTCLLPPPVGAGLPPGTEFRKRQRHSAVRVTKPPKLGYQLPGHLHSSGLTGDCARKSSRAECAGRFFSFHGGSGKPLCTGKASTRVDVPRTK